MKNSLPASVGELIMVFLCPFSGVDLASCESKQILKLIMC